MTELIALTETEQQDLHALETVIETGLQTFIDVGNALAAIRDRRLYRVDYNNFDDYCRERWGLSRFYAHRTIAAAEVVENLLPMGNKLPENERQARPLTLLDDPEQQQQAWSQAVAAAPNGKVTAAHVQAAVDDIRGVDRDDAKDDAETDSVDDPLFPPNSQLSPSNSQLSPSSSPKSTGSKTPPNSNILVDGRKIIVGEIPDQVVFTQLLDRPDWVRIQAFYHAITTIAELIAALRQFTDGDNESGLSEEVEEDRSIQPEPKPAARWRLPIVDVFPTVEAAFWFAVGRGAYPDLRTARKAYETLRDQKQPQNAREMAIHWIKHVHAEAKLPAPAVTM